MKLYVLELPSNYQCTSLLEFEVDDCGYTIDEDNAECFEVKPIYALIEEYIMDGTLNAYKKELLQEARKIQTDNSREQELSRFRRYVIDNP